MKYSLLLLIFLSPVVAHAAIDDCMTRTSVPDEKLNLKQIVDLGLCRNPQTAAAFLSYESARMSKNAGYADYLPSLNLAQMHHCRTEMNNGVIGRMGHHCLHRI